MGIIQDAARSGIHLLPGNPGAATYLLPEHAWAGGASSTRLSSGARVAAARPEQRPLLASVLQTVRSRALAPATRSLVRDMLLLLLPIYPRSNSDCTLK